MSKESMKLALEALESCDQVYGSEGSYQYFSQAKVDKAITAIKQALEQPVAMDEVRELSDGFIENPEAIKYLLDCLRWAQGEDGLPQTHYNFICAFQRKGYAVLQRLNEDYGPEWTFSKHATTPPAAQPAPVQEPVAKDSRDCPYCYHTGSFHCGDVKDKILSNGGDLGYCSNAQIYGRRTQPAAVQPVAFFNPQNGFYWAKPTKVTAPLAVAVEPMPLYTTPQEIVCSTGLCHYKPAAAVQPLPFGVGGGLVAIKTLLSRDPCVHANIAIEMIDAILKEHPAAQPAPVQEPVCHICKGTGEMDHGGTYPWGEAINIPCECTTQPATQRPWVGLTDEEKQELVSDEIGRVRDYEDYADAIEAKLKELNT